MKIIALRGMPGSGKTEVSQELGQKLGCSEVIHVDMFKKKYIVKNTHAQLEEILNYTHMKTLEKIEKCKKKEMPLIIVEEIFNDPIFIEMIMEFCIKNQINISWLHLKREFGQILKVEKERDRVIKNSYEQLLLMQEQLEKNTIPGEIIIQNNNRIEDIVSKIIPQITK